MLLKYNIASLKEMNDKKLWFEKLKKLQFEIFNEFMGNLAFN